MSAPNRGAACAGCGGALAIEDLGDGRSRVMKCQPCNEARDERLRQEGRAAERADVVAWLREQRPVSAIQRDHWASEVERGAHQREGGKP